MRTRFVPLCQVPTPFALSVSKGAFPACFDFAQHERDEAGSGSKTGAGTQAPAPSSLRVGR